MADEKFSEVFVSNPIDVEAGDLLGAAEYNGTTYDKGVFQASQFMRDRYLIKVEIASNNLTVRLLDNSSNYAPSLARPLHFKIGNRLRKCFAATSLTLAAGTQWFGFGSAFAAQEQDLFVYAIWNTGPATDIVDIGLSRVPFLRKYGTDTSATSTDDRYFAYGNATAPNTGDEMTLIGRIPVTLSASASYFWSSAADSDPTQVVNYPIYESRTLTIAPTPTGFSSVPSGAIYRYAVKGKGIEYFIRMPNNGTSNATTFTIPLPFKALTLTNMEWHMPMGSGVDNGANLTSPPLGIVFSGGTSMSLFKDVSTAAWTNANGKRANGRVYYEIAQ